jgi:endonuclease-3
MTGDFRIRKILELLENANGAPRIFRKTPPVDELIRTILSQNTSDSNSVPAFHRLKKHFKSWDNVLKARKSEIARLIKHGGLENMKAERIKAALAEIKKREGRINLANLTRLDTGDALRYLRSLKGVGPKTASCVLLFSFGKPVMPVDTHIFRVAKRIGLIGKDLGVEEAHEVLTLKVPRGLIYRFHLGIIEHGRRTCKSQNPQCGSCVLSRRRLCLWRDPAKHEVRPAGYELS